MKPMIDIAKLCMRYKNEVVALDDINLKITENEFVTIVGPSGCGKSTLIRIVGGLIGSYEGDVTVMGNRPELRCSKSQRLALVFQEANLLPWRKVIDNVRLPLELAGEPYESQISKSINALKIVHLRDFTEVYPAELSGGMKMRVSLARAFVTQPQLMLLDEPFSALDEMTRQQLNEDLLQLWQKDKWSALFITHNIAEAVFLSTRVIVMSHRPGQIIADVAIPFAYPRVPKLRTSVEFAKYLGKVSNLLRGGDHE